MSIIDKAIAAITPPASDEDRAKATQKARAAAGAGDWLSLALDHHDQIRAVCETDVLETDHHPGGLHRLAGGPNLQVAIRHWQRELAQKSLRHRLVVVLPGVDEYLPDARRRLQRLHERRDLHVVGPGADDVDDGFHVSIRSLRVIVSMSYRTWRDVR